MASFAAPRAVATRSAWAAEVAGPRTGVGRAFALVALGVFGVGLFHSLASGLNPADEAYFLHVVNRVLSGEVLYRDVEFPATPLSVYALAGLAALLGREVLVLKLTAAAIHAATALVWLRVDRQLGGAARPGVAMIAAMALAHPSPEALYTPLAMLLLAAAVSAGLDLREGRPGSAALAGAAAGLAFAAKQNVGGLALAAAVALAWPAIRRRRAAATLLGAFAASAVVPLLPSWTAGAGGGLLEYGFSTKGEYLTAARIGWTKTAVEATGALARARGLRAAGEAAWDVWTLLPLVAVAFTAAGLVRGGGRMRPGSVLGRDGVAVAVLLGAALASTYPRMDAAHLSHAVPAAVVAIAWAVRTARRWRPRLGLDLQRGAVACTYGMAAVALPAAALRLRSPDFTYSARPGLRGVRVAVAVEADLARLRRGFAGEPAAAWFHLSPRAGLYYLATGGRDPTPFDYPAASALGRDALSVLEGRLGRDAAVCVDEPRLAALRPARIRPVALEHWVQAHFDRGPDLGACTVYRRRPRP